MLASRVAKRKMSIEQDPSKRGKNMAGAAVAPPPAEEGEESDGDILREMRKMMMGLIAQNGGRP